MVISRAKRFSGCFIDSLFIICFSDHMSYESWIFCVGIQNVEKGSEAKIGSGCRARVGEEPDYAGRPEGSDGNHVGGKFENFHFVMHIIEYVSFKRPFFSTDPANLPLSSTNQRSVQHNTSIHVRSGADASDA